MSASPRVIPLLALAGVWLLALGLVFARRLRRSHLLQHRADGEGRRRRGQAF
ncbi:hypothetical protein [Halomonas sp. BM-2019]|uniref:hypothetical protein n=1 Tax=Halomonas sp. BM-2019 TaxID=2811227 RepID=UPI001B3C231F|nr:MAG: hypothetical protein J5F18_00720 [Halomonas sp. BM-2019]